MKAYKNQKGIGLIEVLVSLLILAVAVLGFVALQIRALEATSEGVNKVQAINLARDISEKIRTNRSALNTYVSSFQGSLEARSSFTVNCYSTFCTSAQKADFDVAQATLTAQGQGMSINMMTCAGIENGRSCIYVAWGDTSPTNANGENDCTTSGIYRPNSSCVVMETY